MFFFIVLVNGFKGSYTSEKKKPSLQVEKRIETVRLQHTKAFSNNSGWPIGGNIILPVRGKEKKKGLKRVVFLFFSLSDENNNPTRTLNIVRPRRFVTLYTPTHACELLEKKKKNHRRIPLQRR